MRGFSPGLPVRADAGRVYPHPAGPLSVANASPVSPARLARLTDRAELSASALLTIAVEPAPPNSPAPRNPAR
ncbi:hypothetical protein [Streptomyces sp. NPDC005476]|uniref:hypothetical protein n=1 Tax=Streptomyces sp. NPDC005476 TaxID=3156882 RepID=UPI00345700A7